MIEAQIRKLHLKVSNKSLETLLQKALQLGGGISLVLLLLALLIVLEYPDVGRQILQSILP